MCADLASVFLALLISPSLSDSLPECSEALARSGASWIFRPDAFLAAHVMDVVASPSALQCGHQCLRRPWCISVNFRQGSGRCDLNDYGAPSADASLDELLTHRPGYVFYQFATADQSCHDNPCQNGGTCIPLTSRTLFGMEGCQSVKPDCVCSAGFHGDWCQYRVGCASNPCLNGATCHQTHGGKYTCLCKTGFSGTYCESVLVFTFPKRDASNFVRYSGVLPNLTQLTICLWMRVDSPGPLGIFSYKPGLGSANANASYVSVLVAEGGQLQLTIGGKYYEFESNITQDGAWHSLCVGWLLLHKMVDVYYDGLTAGTAPPVGMVSSILQLDGYGDLVLGQILNQNGPGVNSTLSFAGQITNFKIWSLKRWWGDMPAIASTCVDPPVLYPDGDAISWEQLIDQPRNGDVTLDQESCP